MDKTTISTIINALKNNKCALVLGPDLYVKEIDGRLVERKQYFTELEKRIEGCIYFPNEDVFLFKKESIQEMQVNVAEFFSNGGDVNLLELIATIKFPLIINASPDVSLYDFCQNNNVPELKVEAFDVTEEDGKPLLFSESEPLLYNVFGDARDQQELMLNHASLFEHVQKIVPENSFPESIREFLKKCTSFIFLGFKFDSWTYQLLSHKILSHKSNKGTQNENRLRLCPTHLDRDLLVRLKREREGGQLKSSNITKDSLISIVMSSSVGMEFTDIAPSQLIDKIIKDIRASGAERVLLRNVVDQERYSSYLSYSHPPEAAPALNIGLVNQALIQTFDDRKKGTALNLIRDQNSLHYGQNIDSFMTRIGKGKTTIMIVSDKYLKSTYCMTEAMRIAKYNNDDQRVFTIIIEGTIEPSNIYEQYWKDKAISLVDNSKENMNEINDCLGFSNDIAPLKKRIDGYRNLKIKLTDFEQNGDGKYHLRADMQNELNGFVDRVILKMKEN